MELSAWERLMGAAEADNRTSASSRRGLLRHLLRPLDLLRELDRAAVQLAAHLWSDAVRDRDRAAWPPLWLIRSGVVLVTVFLLLTVVNFLAKLAAAVGFSIVDLAGSAQLFSSLASLLQRYFERSAPAIGVDPTLAWRLWGAAGLLLLVASSGGFLGARVGWLVYGVATGMFLYLESPTSARLFVTSSWAILWSIFSVAAFFTPLKLKGAGRRLESILTYLDPATRERDASRLDDAAARAGYDSVAAYFDDKGNLKPVQIAAELSIPRKLAEKARSLHVPKDIRAGSRTSPRRKREIIEAARKPGARRSQVAKDYGVSPASVKKWLDSSDDARAVER